MRRMFNENIEVTITPNKYNLKPRDINKLIVLDWPRLKEKTCLNKAIEGNYWCHLEGSQVDGEKYDDSDEFWIGFSEDTGKIEYSFSALENMCNYNIESFYDRNDIENDYDLHVQSNALRFLNELLDKNIIKMP